MSFDPDQLNALSTILQRGSFEAAAAELGVTPSAISQRIKALEDRIGASLINRGTPCTGTPVGARLAKHAEDVGLLEAQMVRELSLDETTDTPTRVRIAVNADSLATWFAGALADAGDLLFDLVIDDQDHSADWLRRGEVSAAVTAQMRPVAGCDAIPLGAMRYLATASPDFAQKWFAEGLTPEALGRAPCLTFNAKDSLQARWIESQTEQRLSPPTHLVPSTHAFVDAARSGLGWGMNPEVLVRGPIRNGRLVALSGTPMDVPLVWQVSRIMAPALAGVTRAIRAAARKGLIAP